MAVWMKTNPENLITNESLCLNFKSFFISGNDENYIFSLSNFLIKNFSKRGFVKKIINKNDSLDYDLFGVEKKHVYVCEKYIGNGLVEEINLGLTLNLLPNTPLFDNAKEYGLETTKQHINDWICIENPTLDYRERLKRRITAQRHVENLGYKVFESQNYVRALSIAWNEVQNLKTKTTKVDASKLKFDREKGVLEQRPDFDPLRTY